MGSGSAVPVFEHSFHTAEEFQASQLPRVDFPLGTAIPGMDQLWVVSSREGNSSQTLSQLRLIGDALSEHRIHHFIHKTVKYPE